MSNFQPEGVMLPAQSEWQIRNGVPVATLPEMELRLRLWPGRGSLPGKAMLSAWPLPTANCTPGSSAWRTETSVRGNARTAPEVFLRRALASLQQIWDPAAARTAVAAFVASREAEDA